MWIYIFGFRKSLRNGSNGLVIEADIELIFNGGFKILQALIFYL